MAKKDLLVGIDVGSSNVRTVIAQVFSEEEKPRIIGVGISESNGLRRGVIVDLEEATHSILDSVQKAEQSAGVEISQAMVSISGNHVSFEHSKGVVAVGRADGEVTEDDVERVINAAQAISVPANREILHIIPKNYSLDDQKDIKDPLEMNGVRLEVDALIIEGSAPYIKNLAKCVAQADIELQGLVLAPLSASKAVLTKRQKELGVVLIDIGAGTTSIAVFEEDDLIYASVLPIGGGHLTNDIAIGLRTSIDVAEKVKLEFGNANPEEVSKKEDINLAEIDPSEEGIVSRYHVCEIIEARLEEIFTMVNKELKKIGKDKLLPAGIILTGGTAKVPGIVDLAKNIMGLPAQTGFPVPLGGLVDKVDDPSFATVVGLLVWGMENHGFSRSVSASPSKRKSISHTASNLGGSVWGIRKWLEKFLP